MIKNLIFDFGKVLVDYDFDQFLSLFIPTANRRMDFFAKFCNQALVNRCDKGDETFEQIILEQQGLYPQWREELQTFHDRQIEAVTGEVEGMYDLLSTLKREGYRLYGLTNWSKEVYAVMERYSRIFELLDGQVISSEEHIIKPDPAIYQRLFERFHLKPEECIFTDDKPENILGSKAVGMSGIVFENARQYEQALSKLGINL